MMGQGRKGREAQVPAVILAACATVDSTSCSTSEESVRRG